MKSLTLQELSFPFLNWVDNSCSLEEPSRKFYRYGWKLLSETRLASLRIDKLTNTDCDCIRFPGGPATANTALRTLRRMLSYAKGKGMLGSVPELSVRKEWPRAVAMTRTQAERIAQFMPDGDSKDALLILRYTGMRPKECFSMRWEYVNWDGEIYQNPRGKRASARRAVPLLYDSAAILRVRYAAQGSPVSGWVFPTCSNQGHLVSIAKQFTKARDRAGFPKQFVLYTARHGAATDLAQVVSLKESMQILGHTDVATALRYQHPNTGDLQAKLTSVLKS